MPPFSDQSLVENFVELYRDLILRSPHLAVHNFRCENSDYSDQLNDSRNAYMCFNGYGLEDCYYCYDSRWNKSSADLSFSNKCELCYECVDTEESYNSNFLQDCERCTDCSYCYDCASCQDCFGCVGLRRAQYRIFNISYSKSEYEQKLNEAKKLPQEKIYVAMERWRLTHPHVAMHSRRSENCVGDYIFDSKDSYYLFKGHSIQDSFYIFNSGNLKDCADSGMLFKSELIYETIEATDNYNCNFLYWCANCRDSEYLMYCFDAEHCFGGFNLKRKKFHILNEPYEREKYFQLVSAIKENLRQKNFYFNFLPDVK